MRKLFALLFVAAAFTFTACNKQGGEQGHADSSATKDSMPASDMNTPAPAPADSNAAAPADSNAAAPAAH